MTTFANEGRAGSAGKASHSEVGAVQRLAEEVLAGESLLRGRLGPNKKKRENSGPELENRKVENPMGIATWPDLATPNAIEKNDKNKCRPLAWEIQIRTIWAGNLFS